jgi:phenylacetate-coenzyme A ligase PaaK-like adenylate-forming protein
MVAPFGFVRHAHEQGRTSGTPGAPTPRPALFKEQLAWFARM